MSQLQGCWIAFMKANCSHKRASLWIHGVYWHFQYVTNLRTEILTWLIFQHVDIFNQVSGPFFIQKKINTIKITFLTPEFTTCFFCQGPPPSQPTRRLRWDYISCKLLEKKIRNKCFKRNFIFILL